MNESEQIFLEETKELLIDLESALLDLEETPDDIESINRAFRAMHTIKGSGSMFGYTEINRFTHQLEGVFDRIRKGETAVNQEIINVGLKARDHIEYLVTQNKDTTDSKTDDLLQELAVASEIELIEETPIEGQGELEWAQSSDSTEQTYRIKIIPSEDALENGMDIAPLIRELIDLGKCSVTTQTRLLPFEIEQFNPEHLYLQCTVILTTSSALSDIEDVFIFVNEDWDISIDNISVDDEAEILPIGQILAEQAAIDSNSIEETLNARPKTGEYLVKQGLVTEEQIQTALTEQSIQRETVAKKANSSTQDTLKINIAKLDKLMDLVGELVITQARLDQISKQVDSDELETINESFSLLTSELRDTTLDIRMLPLGSTFGSFRRLIRDLSSQLDKKVTLITHGEDTELDKTLIDKLSDPLVHLLRNSMDHGIEDPETRVNNGKPAQGKITLSASHQESNVIIRISDDGAGIDHLKLIDKALGAGIIQDGHSLSKDEALKLIFAPGFSTAESVSNISGRGVGMDAVKNTVESLGGKIRLSSEIGVGTSITIELPLTLAIIDGLLVTISGEAYVLPLSMVEECVEVQEQNQENTLSTLIEVRGSLVPQIRLRHWFDSKGNTPPIQQSVITKYRNKHLGLIVDEVIGEHQTVIKSLGPAFQHIKGISGATILGSGNIALILDIPALAEAVEQFSSKTTIH